MLCIRLPNAKQARADVCSGGKQEAMGLHEAFGGRDRALMGWTVENRTCSPKGTANSHSLGRLTILGGYPRGKHKSDVADLSFTLASASSPTPFCPPGTTTERMTPPGMFLSLFNSTRPLKAASCRELNWSHMTSPSATVHPQ